MWYQWISFTDFHFIRKSQFSLKIKVINYQRFYKATNLISMFTCCTILSKALHFMYVKFLVQCNSEKFSGLVYLVLDYVKHFNTRVPWEVVWNKSIQKVVIMEKVVVYGHVIFTMYKYSFVDRIEYDKYVLDACLTIYRSHVIM